MALKKPRRATAHSKRRSATEENRELRKWALDRAVAFGNNHGNCGALLSNASRIYRFVKRIG